ncbi:MAG TPA: threonine synthase [Clostridia bacterium]|nr:threonine synthase [Clostridia bacterium]
MYISTRGNYPEISASQAIKVGMVPAGGLFVPTAIPRLSLEEIGSLVGTSYQALAETILARYLDDYTGSEIRSCVAQAYNESSFGAPEVTPLRRLEDGLHILELWHGPTAAFKDVALQLMPHLLSRAVRKVGSQEETVILVATSGDTGKAALEGFKDVPGIRIIVFYPHEGVSKIQQLQMTTTDGANTYVVGVKGNFDDCQTGVKNIFGDKAYAGYLAAQGFALSSANSINWGRLLPQVVYYFSAYLQLVARGVITLGDRINFVVPTGNFGNILAGWYASAMGLPVHKLICASNENKVLADFFASGTYDRRREFRPTISPSMDILISSNLERFLFEMNGRDAAAIQRWMESLQAEGYFAVDPRTKEAMDEVIWGGYATEAETLEAIREVYREYGYTLDPHTAVGMKVYRDYRRATGDTGVTVLAATASPFKFNASVLMAIAGEESLQGLDEFAMLEELARLTGMPVHPGLAGLDRKEVRHHRLAAKDEFRARIEEILGLK